ncbi:MAG: hypothetical protein H6Q73_3853, partial [Firmicutes bacterium]|nr:hypothetical protein [Bacillota bacterium]
GYKVDAKTIDTAKCIKCGNCERVCPANNIQKDGSKYVFGENCENCFACAHWCPVRALTLGRLTPDDKTHYTHPNVTLQDIIGQKNGTQSG